MSISGTWNITVKTPMGDQTSSVMFEEHGASVTGTLTSDGGESPVEKGAVDGDNLTWTASIKKPMPLTLDFSGKIEGRTISGKVKLGMFGDAPFSGSKV